MKLIIDRFECDYVACENSESGEIINLDRLYFPIHAKEGDLVEFVDGVITILQNEETQKRIEEKMNNLWE